MEAVSGQSPVARFWREAREDPELASLVRDTYMDADPSEAARRYAASDEFAETWRLITAIVPAPQVAVDLGAGNGIGAAALVGRGVGFVHAVEPEPDDVIGQGAIRRVLPEGRGEVIEAVGEALPLPDGIADVVYARQVLHHASDLPALVRESARVLRSGGVFVSLRDHVIEAPSDLEAFLATHAVHQEVGGENAFPLHTYVRAVEVAGLRVRLVLGPFDSIVNAFPGVRTSAELAALPRTVLETRFGTAGRIAAALPPVRAAVARRIRRRRWPGAPFSLVAVKP